MGNAVGALVVESLQELFVVDELVVFLEVVPRCLNVFIIFLFIFFFVKKGIICARIIFLFCIIFLVFGKKVSYLLKTLFSEK